MFKQTLHHCPVVFLSKDKVFAPKFVFMRYQRFLRASNDVKVFFVRVSYFLLHFFRENVFYVITFSEAVT